MFWGCVTISLPTEQHGRGQSATVGKKPLQSCCFSNWNHSTHALCTMGRPFSIPSCGVPWWQCGHWRPVTSPPCCSEWKSIFNWLDYSRLRWVSCAPLKDFFSPGSAGAIHVEKLKALRSEMSLLQPGLGANPPFPPFPRQEAGSIAAKSQSGRVDQKANKSNYPKILKIKNTYKKQLELFSVCIFFPLLLRIFLFRYHVNITVSRQLPEGWVKWEEGGGRVT